MDRDQQIAAFVDGEMTPETRGAFEAQMRADPALADAVGRQQRLRRMLSNTYDPVLNEPVPPQMTMTATVANDPAPRRRLPQWAAMAACLAAGVLIGQAVMPEQGPFTQARGGMAARGALAKTLDQGLAADAGPIRVGLSFQTADGGYCRTFQSEPDRLAGLTCRDGDRWVARTLTSWTPKPTTDYRTAGAETPPEILAAVDALIVGEPLDADGEAAARAKAWAP